MIIGDKGGDEIDGSGSNEPNYFTQSELNDLVRVLKLEKDAGEFLGSRRKENHLLATDTSFSWYHSRAQEFCAFFL